MEHQVEIAPAAIGRVTDEILKKISLKESFEPNIVVTASTVYELVDLVSSGKVDAAIMWKDMLNWDEAKGLVVIKIPADINKIKQIAVGVLSTSMNSKLSIQFAEYVATDGRAIFEKHGFTNK